MLTLVMGLSVAQICREMGLDAWIKWPNDVVVSGKKICGILTEMSAQVDYVNYVVIGTGINVNLSVLPPELKRDCDFFLSRKERSFSQSSDYR